MIEIRVSTPALVVVLLGVVLVGVAIGAWAATLTAERNTHRFPPRRFGSHGRWGTPTVAAVVADEQRARLLRAMAQPTREWPPVNTRHDDTTELHNGI